MHEDEKPGETVKPAGERDADNAPRAVDERQAARNQGEVSPEDYPVKASAKLTGDLPGSRSDSTDHE